MFVMKCGSVGSFHSGSQCLATLNLTEYPSATGSFLGRLSSLSQGTDNFCTCQSRYTVQMTAERNFHDQSKWRWPAPFRNRTWISTFTVRQSTYWANSTVPVRKCVDCIALRIYLKIVLVVCHMVLVFLTLLGWRKICQES
jgi:hypothetical protein